MNTNQMADRGGDVCLISNKTELQNSEKGTQVTPSGLEGKRHVFLFQGASTTVAVRFHSAGVYVFVYLCI